MVVVPNGPFMINRFLARNPTPYPILTDKGAQVAGQYFQKKGLFNLGTPAVILVAQGGTVAYTHYANSLIAEPDNAEPLAVLANLSSNHPLHG